MHRSAWLEMTDRQVLIAIGLTVLLVIGLVFSTRTPEASRGPTTALARGACDPTIQNAGNLTTALWKRQWSVAWCGHHLQQGPL